VNPLGWLLAVAIGVALGFFGGGGSILTVPLLVYVFGLAPKTAIASSLLVVAAASASGALQHARAGHLRWRTGLVFGSAGMLGAYLGGRAAAFVDGEVLLLLFASLMIWTSLALWRGRRAAPQAGDPQSLRAARIGRLWLQGLAVGSFTGLVGAGGGFLIVPALVLWAGLPVASAVATSLFVIVLQSLAGFGGYASHVAVEPRLVAGVAACAVAGSLAGARLARRVAPSALRRAFAGFVLAMGALMLVREGRAFLAAASAALPHSVPQLLFALAMLAIGVWAGRGWRAAPATAQADYRDGEGI
jgi:uncharacterized membrane protein YfcA